MISGMFSIIYQGINTRVMPMFKVDYTSYERRSQIYIGSVNWFLLFAVLFIMLQFQESSRLAAACIRPCSYRDNDTYRLYDDMDFYQKKQPIFAVIAVLVTFIDIMYLSANFTKIPHGGYWS